MEENTAKVEPIDSQEVEPPYKPMPLLNLHQVLDNAMTRKIREKADADQVPFNFRVPEHIKAKATEILSVKGLTPTDFLRECMIRLVEEYGG